MNIGITGGAGFIGAALALRLQQHHTVHVLDAFTDYYDVQLKEERADELRRAGVTVTTGDVHHDLDAWMETSFDAVFHLAALPGVPRSLEEPHHYIREDIDMTVTLLEAAKRHGMPHVFFASSSSVYGEQTGPLKEEQATGHVASPYAAAKYSAESFCHAYAHLYDVNVTLFRFFTVYGPSGRPDMALFRFIEQALRGETLTVFGDPIRDFTYIDDITRGMEQALLARAVGTYNLGANQPVSVRTLAERIGQRFDVPVQTQTARRGDVTMTWSDTTAAQKAFGYQPSIEIDVGLEQVIAWHQNR